ncbi:MAG TPA: hypothetical protein VFC84_14725 [Desulfosporosinus sp.]|nr:hypothetical protein [Desulfosporosinus sp.]
MDIISEYRSKKQRQIDEDARLIAKVIRKAAKVSKRKEQAQEPSDHRPRRMKRSERTEYRGLI